MPNIRIFIYPCVVHADELGNHSWKRLEQATLNDVAREAGVSQSAASVVINGARSGTRISPERRRLILEAADRIGYRPNSLARSLITGKTNLIGVYSGRSRLDSRNLFFAELLGGIFEGCGEVGANTVVHTNEGGQNQLLDLVTSRSLDGLIVHAANDDPILKLIDEIRVPAVAVADIVKDLPSVVVDDVAGGRLQAQHLLMRGHRSVMIKIPNYPTESARLRIESFKASASEFGVSYVDSLETFGEDDGLSKSDIRLIGQGKNRITAVVGWSDHTGHRVCAKLASLGISIPDEIAVVGFDGFSMNYLQKYPLTTIRAPWSEVGRVSARFVKSLSDNESVPKVTTLPVEFIRGSTT